MSFFESTVVMFYVMLHVSCVSSHISTDPDEVTAVEEFVKVDNFYYNTIPAFVESGNKDNYDGRQKKDREKRNTASDFNQPDTYFLGPPAILPYYSHTTAYLCIYARPFVYKAMQVTDTLRLWYPGNLAAAAQLPMSRLWRLTTLLFRNMFSTEPIDGDPPLNPPKAAQSTAMMLRKGLDIFKGKK